MQCDVCSKHHGSCSFSSTQRNDCSKPHGSCSFSSTQCCWCLDTRTYIWIDIENLGTFDPAVISLRIPRDLHYCSHCKLSTTPTAEYFLKELLIDVEKEIDYFTLRKSLGPEYNRRLKVLYAYRREILHAI